MGFTMRTVFFSSQSGVKSNTLQDTNFYELNIVFPQ